MLYFCFIFATVFFGELFQSVPCENCDQSVHYFYWFYFFSDTGGQNTFLKRWKNNHYNVFL